MYLLSISLLEKITPGAVSKVCIRINSFLVNSICILSLLNVPFEGSKIMSPKAISGLYL